MHKSENISELAEALAKAQETMENAPLNKVNPHFKSKYADLAAIRDAVVPALSAHGIAVTQTTDLTADGRVVVETTLMHKSGQWVMGRFPVLMPAAATPQAAGSATTYARRYALAAMVGIAAEEDDDASAAEDAAKKSTVSKPAQQQPTNNTQTVTKGNGKADPFEAFWKRNSYILPAANSGEWAAKFANACDKAPTLPVFQKLEADNKKHIDALDGDLYRDIVQPAIEKAMVRLSEGG